jgi:thiol-disulfide isomerase/thioredoxin
VRAVPSQVPPRGGGGKKPPQRQGKQAVFKAKKRQQRLLAAIGGGVVVVVIVVLVVVGLNKGTSSGIDTRHPISAASLQQVLSVTPAEMKTAAANIKLQSYPITVNSTELTAAGKPELLYIGAEYCPYCAGERWAMVMALSQFGSFTGLRSVTSTPTDTVASIPTFTFYQSTYSSPYLTFKPVEQQTVSGKALETPTTAELASEQKFDGPPYVQSGGIPFMDFGGKYIQDGINFDNSSMAHKSFDAIAQQLGGTPAGPSTPVAGSIAATAGVMISHLCNLTGGKSLHNNAACQTFPSPISSASTS